MNQRGLRIMIASAVTVFPWGKRPADDETFNQTRFFGSDYRYNPQIHSNHSMIAFNSSLSFPPLLSVSLHLSTYCCIISLSVKNISPPHVFDHFIHHLFSLSIALLLTHLLSSSHTYMRKPFVTSLLRFDKTVCASGTGGMTAVEMTKRDE